MLTFQALALRQSRLRAVGKSELDRVEIVGNKLILRFSHNLSYYFDEGLTLKTSAIHQTSLDKRLDISTLAD